MSATFRVQGVLGMDGSGFYRTLTEAEQRTTRFAGSMTRAITNRLAGLFTAGAMAGAIRASTEYAGRLVDINARTGESIESLQRLDRSMIEHGATLDNLVGFWERLDRARAEALKNPEGAQASAFTALGVSPSDLASRSASDITRNIAAKFQSSLNTEELIAPLLQVGGRGAGAMVSAFRDGLDQMYQDINVMTSETAIALDALDDKFTSLKNTISIALAPAIVRVVDYLTAFVNDMRRKVEFFTQLFYSFSIDRAKVALEEIDAQIASEIQSENRRRAGARTRPDTLSFSPFDTESTKAAKASGDRILSDSLIAVGNFLGAGRNTLETLANRQLSVMQQIERNTRPKPEGNMQSEFETE